MPTGAKISVDLVIISSCKNQMVHLDSLVIVISVGETPEPHTGDPVVVVVATQVLVRVLVFEVLASTYS